jgi:hypothetical protein
MKNRLVAGMVALSLTGCATIISSTTQTVSIRSAPEGASVIISNRAGEKIHSGTTPVTVTLKKGAGYFKPEVYTLRFEKDSYVSKEVTITGEVSGWYFGNIIFGGLILGMLIVDPLSGAMFTLTPDKVEQMLDAVGAKTSKGDGSLTIVLVKDVPPEIMKQAQRIN